MIKVVGLGIGNLDDLSRKAASLLQSTSRLITTASWHPVFSSLDKAHIEVWDGFSPEEITSRLNQVGEGEDVVLAVSGDPALDHSYLRGIKNKLELLGAPSLLALLELPEAFLQLDAESLKSAEDFGAKVVRVHPGSWEQIKKALPQDADVVCVDKLQVGKGKVEQIYIEDGYVFIPGYVAVKKTSAIDALLTTMRKLRAPDGCPWDRIQTFESLKPYLVEEAYELWDAIDSGDMDLVTEELGDVLLQVVFYAAIAEEEGLFDFEDVARVVNEKLIHRHPHVFAEVVADTPEKVMANWERLKKEEKGKEDRVSILDGVPKHLPGLQKAAKVQKKAAKVGFDWDGIEPVWQKVSEELQELSEAKTPEEREEELGDVLFAIVNLSRFLKIDAEVALSKTIAKFQKRFRYIEKHADRPLDEMTLEEMDVYWEKAKEEDK